MYSQDVQKQIPADTEAPTVLKFFLRSPKGINKIDIHCYYLEQERLLNPHEERYFYTNFGLASLENFQMFHLGRDSEIHVEFYFFGMLTPVLPGISVFILKIFDQNGADPLFSST